MPDVQQFTTDMNWAADQLEARNPDRSAEFSDGVDWAISELRRMATGGSQGDAP